MKLSNQIEIFSPAEAKWFYGDNIYKYTKWYSIYQRNNIQYTLVSTNTRRPSKFVRLIRNSY